MNVLRRAIARATELLTPGRLARIDRELSEEVQSHIDHLADEYVRRGLTRDDARRKARRAFSGPGGPGGVEQAKEAIRDSRGIPMFEHLATDIRRAVRSLSKARGFTAIAVITLALGIGVNTAIFSVLDAVVLRPLPYPKPDRLVSIYEIENIRAAAEASAGATSLIGGTDDPGRGAVAPANFVDYQTRTNTFASMAGYARFSSTLTGIGAPESVLIETVTDRYFDVLGVAPAIGRPLAAADAQPGAPLVVVISDAVWRSHFGADPNIVGRNVRMNDEPHQIVGVMPAGFEAVSQFTITPRINFWTALYFPPELLANHGDHEIDVVARLAPGASVASAESAITGVSEALASQFPQTNSKVRAHVRPLGKDVVRKVETSLVVIMLMVGFILLIACANVANLLIVRGAGKRREVSIRYALGAGRGRVMSEMLTESVVLAVAACIAGVALAFPLKDLIVSMAPTNLPRLANVGLDLRVIGFSALLALVTSLVFGVLPAWQTRHARPIDALTTGGRMVASRWTMRWRNGLMVAEIAVSTILLVGAALMVKSLVSLTSVELGFRTDNVLALSVGLPVSRYKTQDDRLAFFEKLEVEIRRLPGVQHVGYANRFPLRGAWSSGFAIDGFNDGKFVTANFQAVSPGYFDTLGLRLVRGRLLTPADIKTSEPVAVVSEAFSKRLLNGAEPLGVRFRRAPTFPWITVVGVIADLRRDGQKAAIEPEVYLAAGQTQLYPTRLADIAILTSGDPRPLANSLRDAVWAVDKDQPVANVRTLEESVSMAARESRFQATLVGLFALLALTLAVVGIHGVVSYAVSQRTPEIGVRMALGADRLTILRWLLSGTALLVGVGSVIGIAGAAWLSTYVRSLLFQVQPTDIGTYALSALLLSTVALGAAALAARKATLIDPVTALRSE